MATRRCSIGSSITSRGRKKVHRPSGGRLRRARPATGPSATTSRLEAMKSRTWSASERGTNVETERATCGGLAGSLAGVAVGLLVGASVRAITTSKWSRSTAISMSV